MEYNLEVLFLSLRLSSVTCITLETDVLPIERITKDEGQSVITDEGWTVKIRKDLLHNYDRNFRPYNLSIGKNNDVTKISFELFLLDILDVDEINQEIRTNVKIIMKWRDPFLHWNPMEYGNVSFIPTYIEDIWSPDIILYNSIKFPELFGSMAHVKPNGEVTHVGNAYIESVCNFDLQWFPFDQQVCEYKFASASYDTKAMVFEFATASLSRYRRNNEFFMENFNVTKTENYNLCCQDKVSSLIFRMQFQRNSVQTTHSLILATSLFTIAAVYISLCMGLITINHLASALILNWALPGEESSLPRWLKTTTNLIAQLFWFPKRNLEEDLDEESKSNDGRNLTRNDVGVKSKFPNPCKNTDPLFDSQTYECKAEGNSGKDLFEQRFLKAVEDLASFYTEDKMKKIRKKVQPSKSEQEWIRVSRICDRVCLVICVLSFLVFATAVLMSSPFKTVVEYHPKKGLPSVKDA